MKHLYNGRIPLACTLALALGHAVSGQVYKAVGTTDGSNSTGATSLTGNSYPTPFGDYYENSRAQYLYRASELTAAGIPANVLLTDVRWQVTSVNGSGIHENYTLKVGLTTDNQLPNGGFLASPAVQYGPVDYTPVAGANSFELASPIVWDGTSNLLVEICHVANNTTSGNTYTNNALTAWTTGLSFRGSSTSRADNNNTPCATTTFMTGSSQNKRPWISVGHCAAPVSVVSGTAAMCANGALAPGDALATGTCPTNNVAFQGSFPGSNFACEGTSFSDRSTLAVPALPAGAVITGARLKLFNVTATTYIIQTSRLSQIRVALSGMYTLGSTQLSTSETSGTLSPDPVIDLPGFPATGGNLVLRTLDNSNQSLINPDGSIGSASLEIDYTLTPLVNWYDAASGGNLVHTGTSFDPVAAGVVSASASGTYTFHAVCELDACGTRMPTTFTIHALPSVDAGADATVCSADGVVALAGTPLAGTWSGAGVTGETFDPSAGTQEVTYSVTDLNGCSNSDALTITVEESTAWYTDVDGDGFGDPASMVMACEQPANTIADGSDTCPVLAGQVGDGCDDGNPFTTGDVITAGCACAGTPVPCDDWTLKVTTDDLGNETTWSIVEATNGFVLASGGPYFPLAMTTTETICIPQGSCFNLVVSDAGGNGITNGGFVLADNTGKRVIDNAGNGSNFTSTSQAPQPFCSPVGSDRVIDMQQDHEAWFPTQVIYASENPTVSAEWNVGDQTDDGYQFWFFDPNGGYSRRVFRSHAAHGGHGLPNAIRATKLALGTITTSPLPHNVLLNVRVRGRVNGVDLAWGAATRFRIDIETANCMPTHLIDVPGPYLSCGRTDVRLDGHDRIWAVPVSRPAPGGTEQQANRYRFRFENADENFVRVITAPTYWLTMAVWATNPLQPGMTYEVTVQASYDNGTTWCATGRMCEITTEGALAGSPALRSLESVDEAGTTFGIWPNPGNGELINIHLSGLPLVQGTVQMTVTDVLGRTVMTEAFAHDTAELNVQWTPTSALTDGTYLISLRSGDRVITQRIVVQR